MVQHCSKCGEELAGVPSKCPSCEYYETKTTIDAKQVLHSIRALFVQRLPERVQSIQSEWKAYISLKQPQQLGQVIRQLKDLRGSSLNLGYQKLAKQFKQLEEKISNAIAPKPSSSLQLTLSEILPLLELLQEKLPTIAKQEDTPDTQPQVLALPENVRATRKHSQQSLSPNKSSRSTYLSKTTAPSKRPMQLTPSAMPKLLPPEGLKHLQTMRAKIGETIDNRYQIVELLGKGTAGTVFRVFDLQQGKPFALKLLTNSAVHKTNMLKRFQREMKLLSSLHHPNLLQIDHYHSSEQQHYFTTELITGGTLEQRLRKSGALSPIEALCIVEKIASALFTAHQARVLHRDIKPANILLTKQQEPVLSDFGLAFELDQSSARLTRKGMVVGTPYYLSPEQTMHGAELNASSDLYSLGVVFYEMLIGTTPYHGFSTLEVLISIRQEALPKPTEYNPSIPSIVQDFCMTAVAHKPEERFQNGNEMALKARQVIELLK